ncbi:MAG: hypothetical protein IPK19_00755 [Chloroflexi bacterium]|nr:hypothetical protein [Chloroflexota bacterium]
MTQWHNEIGVSTLTLDGDWQFSLDGQSGTIRTPGVWEAQGFPRRVEGPATFRRSVFIPADWQGQRIQLQFDAVSYYVEARLNGIPVGDHTGMWTAFALDVTEAARPGQENTLELVVYKPGERFAMRESLAGFLPDVCIPFGGIWQSARLVAFPGPAIGSVWLLPDAETGRVRLEAKLYGAQGMHVVVHVLDPEGNLVASWSGTDEEGTLDIELYVPAPHLWSPESPVRYTAEIRLEEHGVDRAVIRRFFAFRTLSTEGDQLRFNGDPVILRGVLSWGWFPDKLCPAPDDDTIREEFRRIRALGYNFYKLCLYVPSDRLFEIADEEGMFLWLELPMWLPQVSDRMRRQAPIEYADILAQVHTHPSVVIYSLGCELDNAVNAELLGELNGILRGRTSGVLACDNSGSGEAYGGLTFDYADFNDYHFYADLHYFTPLVDHFSRDWRPARPWIFGEFCDADDYRDLDELAAAYGGELPWWLVEKNPIHSLQALGYPLQRERMAALTDLGFSGQDLQRISRQQSFVIRKTILEKVRGRAGMGGYVVTGVRDTPLATSSMFDDLGRAKYDAESFKAFNTDTVLVLEQGRRRLWKRGGDRPFPVDRDNLTAGASADYRVVVSHAGAPLDGAVLRWRLLDSGGAAVAGGESAIEGPILAGSPREIGSLAFTAPEASGEYTLVVELGEVGYAVHNRWPLWIYPAPATPPPLAWYDPSGCLEGLAELAETALDLSRGDLFAPTADRLLVTSAATRAVLDFVRGGGRAVILQTGPGSLPAVPRPFWRESIKLIFDHPVWQGFPHRGYADLQFYHLATDYALDTARWAESVPDLTAVTPIMRRMDARQFTLTNYLVEVRLGSGSAFVSSLRFGGGAGDQVTGLTANVAGRHLLGQMLQVLTEER